ncbi:uncharacterized protein LOC110925296 [Helianthus annuus]|uniref:uncharacterized protein LOC110925296 n=1 Tax=Helianthus annuus TaxID=4232 RepID=UPI000B8F1192|nr:uncharacterized protein LOC110925296 [Helianthus annuus]
MSNRDDVWIWRHFENEDFCVKNVRLTLGRNLDINAAPNAFCWNNWATGKSTTFVWRAIDEKIPSAVALTGRGMLLQDMTCKICGADDENAMHILLRCNFVKRVWEAVSTWTNFPMPNNGNSVTELLQSILECHRSRFIRKILHAIAIQTMWILWRNRNDTIFSGKQRTAQMIIEEVKDTSLQGVRQRSKHNTITKQQWSDFNFNE